MQARVGEGRGGDRAERPQRDAGPDSAALQVRPARQRATVLPAVLPAVRRAPEALPAVVTVHPEAAAGVPHPAQDALPLAEAAGLRADAQEDSLTV